jgi:hypothetical protein
VLRRRWNESTLVKMNIPDPTIKPINIWLIKIVLIVNWSSIDTVLIYGSLPVPPQW